MELQEQKDLFLQNSIFFPFSKVIFPPVFKIQYSNLSDQNEIGVTVHDMQRIYIKINRNFLYLFGRISICI